MRERKQSITLCLSIFNYASSKFHVSIFVTSFLLSFLIVLCFWPVSFRRQGLILYIPLAPLTWQILHSNALFFMKSSVFLKDDKKFTLNDYRQQLKCKQNL